jgi:epoxyqueuosine reductase
MNLKQEVTRFAKDIGFDLVGFTNAAPFMKERRILTQRKSEGLTSPFEDGQIDTRCFPDIVLPGAKTIICTAIGYLTNMNNSGTSIGGDRVHGKISRYALVNDYHFVIRNKLNAVVDFIAKRRKGNFVVLVDSGSIIEKAAAKRAGIGWLGQNTCLFTPKFGSWVFLGEILTDIEIEPDEPADSQCDNCGHCVKACPTGALFAPFQLNPYKCLSYITQMRGMIPEEFRIYIGNRIFGCDTCQEACPKNLHIETPDHSEFSTNSVIDTNLYKVAKLSKGEFNTSYAKTPAGWRGRNTIRRNAVCALANTLSSDALIFLKDMLNDPSYVVSQHVRWAVNRLK